MARAVSRLLCADPMARFVFAINTISMVKNDALFSYIAPSNIFAWLLMPLRYCMPLKHFVWLNRTIIKVTHFPVLFVIYLYEKFWLAPTIFEPTDLVENHGRSRSRVVSFRDPTQRTAMFSPNIRVREESVAGFHKDRALEEVFRLAPDAATWRTQRRDERRKNQTTIRNWMDQHEAEGIPSSNWPTVDSRAAPEWQRRLSAGWGKPSQLRQVSDVRSTASDPADFLTNPQVSFSLSNAEGPPPRNVLIEPDYKDLTDADGDDELVTNDEDEDDVTNADRSNQFERHGVEDEEDYFTTPKGGAVSRLASSHGSSAKKVVLTPRLGSARRGAHARTVSTNTILYKPEDGQANMSSLASPSKAKPIPTPRKPHSSGRATGTSSPSHAGRRNSPKRAPYLSTSKPRPIPATRGMTDSGGVTQTAMMSLAPRDRLRAARRLSSVDLSIMSDNMGLEENHVTMAGSFQTQMAMALMKDNRLRGTGGESADRDRMGRLVLARMKTLEESFADVIKEMRDLKNLSTAPHSRRNSSAEELRPVPGGSEPDRPKKKTGEMTPRKGLGRSPGSRRSMREGKPFNRNAKGKVKDVGFASEEQVEADTDGNTAGDDSFTKKGSSL